MKLARNIHQVLQAGEGSTLKVAPTGVGKALDLNTPIPTPHGWTTMAALQLGDKVFDENGEQCAVTGVSPVMHGRKCYEVVFSTGDSIVADAEHLWPSATRDLRFVQAERRKRERCPVSKAQLNRLGELESKLENLGGSFMVDHAGAARYLSPDVTLDNLSRKRRAIGGPTQRKGDKFDLVPVLRRIIDSVRSRTSLASTPPPDYSVLTTEQMRQSLVGNAGESNHAIQLAGALKTEAKKLPVDPYLFGVWLGDGDTGSGGITVGRDDVGEMQSMVERASAGRVSRRVKGTGFRLMLHPVPGLCRRGHDYQTQPGSTCRECYRQTARGQPRSEATNVGLTQRLKQMGTLGAKRIPVKYLRASCDQRVALLQGLMDSDGSVGVTTGMCELTLMQEELARDAYELVSTLGVRANLTSGPARLTQVVDGRKVRKDCGTRWRITFTPNIGVFRLSRKKRAQSRFVGRDSRRSTGFRYVKKIRPVPSRPVRCIAVSSTSRLFLAGHAMIPTHNSLAALTPAAMLALQGGRTLISTESLGLQHQVTHKDFPAVRAAVADATGVKLDIAVFKGWSNYACLMAAAKRAHSEAQTAGKGVPGSLGNVSPEDLDELSQSATSELTQWALNTSGTGNRSDFPGRIEPGQWEEVSITPDACLSLKCPLRELCFPEAARSAAANAEVVVTNHSMLAVQAAKLVPVVIGSKHLGQFDAVVVDEAHALPSKVRDMGAVTVSSRSLAGAARRLEDVTDPASSDIIEHIKWSSSLIAELDKVIDTAAKAAGGHESRVGEDDDVLGDVGQWLMDWYSAAVALVNAHNSHAGGAQRIEANKAVGRMSDRREEVRAAMRGGIGVARWFELPGAGPRSPRSPSLRVSPVDVSDMLASQVWSTPMDPEDVSDEAKARFAEKMQAYQMAGDDGEGSEPRWPRRQLPVVTISATLPKGFGRDVGLSGQIGEYESPFAGAYADSMLYVPRMDAGGRIAPTRNFGKKVSLDTGAHADWALGLMTELLEANGGSALVLSATASSGQRYAQGLRARFAGQFQVLSQWDGLGKEATTAAWKDDVASVLVGTRSYMTGVDAPGRTCSLVIVDRVPRAAGNVVDDARVEVLAEYMNEFKAREAVYAVDAAQLLAQASGRLIRATSDSGLVAVLDPRLLKKQQVSYSSNTRSVYMGSLRNFERKTANLGVATAYLRAAAEQANSQVRRPSAA